MLYDFPHRERRFSHVGSPIRELFSPVFDEHYRKHLACTGSLDLHESIQASAELTDLNSLLQRYNAGELTALNQREAFYGDATLYSGQTLQSMLNNLRDVKASYDSLSADEKALSGFTCFDDYLKKALGSDLEDFNKVLKARVDELDKSVNDKPADPE